MALYRNSADLEPCRTDQNVLFDRTYTPDELAPESGICRCIVSGCGLEDVCEKGKKFPPASNHDHKMVQVNWRLVALADPKKKNEPSGTWLKTAKAALAATPL